MIKELTERILQKEDIPFETMYEGLSAILQGQCSEVSIAGFLTALAAKGETAEEVAGMAKSLRDHAVPVRPTSEPLVDVVGTGGDGHGTLNISTAAALVSAGAGVKVAKHGNRAITSQCGSADVLAELGVKIDAEAEVIQRCIDEAGMGFMFAPKHHPAMRYVQPIRKSLGFRTVFNILGPLANPAKVPIQLVGVAKPYLLEVMAEALQRLGLQRGLVVHGDGLDEMTVCGVTDVVAFRDGKLSRYQLDSQDYGIGRVKLEELKGGDLKANAQWIRELVGGKRTDGSYQAVVFNAAGVIQLAGLSETLEEGIQAARLSIETGSAKKVLEGMVEISQS